MYYNNGAALPNQIRSRERIRCGEDFLIKSEANDRRSCSWFPRPIRAGDIQFRTHVPWYWVVCTSWFGRLINTGSILFFERGHVPEQASPSGSHCASARASCWRDQTVLNEFGEAFQDGKPVQIRESSSLGLSSVPHDSPLVVQALSFTSALHL